jgi:hypothetical protein
VTPSEAALRRSFPFGVYGALAGQPGLGQNWRGKSDAYFRQRWSSTVFERAFTKSSTDDTGCLQIRRDGTDWVLATSRPFAGRNQRTRLVTRIPGGELWDWILPALRALQALPDERAYETAVLELERPRELVDEERTRLRVLFPCLHALERGISTGSLPLHARGTAIEPAELGVGFEDLALCAAFVLELVLPHGAGDEVSATVLSAPIAMIEPSDLLEADFALIFAPERVLAAGERGGTTRRNTVSHALEPAAGSIRDVPLAKIQALEPAEFDALFTDFRAGKGRWCLPLRCLPAHLWTDGERQEIYALWLASREPAWMRAAAADLAGADRKDARFELGLLAGLVGLSEEIPVLEDLVPAEQRAQLLALCRADEPRSA